MNRVIVLIIILFLSACSTFTSSYNTPFINADETILLQEGMSKNSVLGQIGEPLYVDFGIAETMVWVYEVRTITVLSDTTPTGEMIPNKTGTNVRHSTPIHQLKVVFVNGEVQRWETINIENAIETDESDIPPESPISMIKNLILSYIN